SPYLVLSSYILDVVYALFNITNVGRTRAVVLDVHVAFGYMYTSFDIILNTVAIILIMFSRKQDSGVTILLIGRVIHRILFTLWTMFFYFLLDDAFDVGCILILLAAKIRQNKRHEWVSLDSWKLELLLLAGRLCMCSIFIVWLDEEASNIFYIIAVALLFPLSLGLNCQFFSFLTICAILYHDIFSNQASFVTGWDDSFLSVEYFMVVFSKLGGFLLLSVLGGGKWSIDGFRNRKAEKRDQKSGYRLMKNQTTA
ncbi:hypothetical protein KR067_003562, partial [Drosophila pandora]